VQRVVAALQKAWYSPSRWVWILWPFERLFCYLAKRRRNKQQQQCWHAPIPVIVVGNIQVGGTGKSPLVVALIEYLRSRGYRPGIVSRGYGAQSKAYPLLVNPQMPPSQCGDEPIMLVKRTGAPLVIDPDRVAACQYLLEQTDCDLIISDDGLQHYRMGRDIEIAVVDASRGVGNGHCLPMGPLREPPSRLAEVDMVVLNGQGEFQLFGAFHMQLQASEWVRLSDGKAFPLHERVFSKVHGIAGIGHPDRFFSTLTHLGLQVIEHSFPDHYAYTPADIAFGDSLPVIMTEKDAVKCRTFACDERYYYLKVEALLAHELTEQLDSLLKRIDK